jgi:hypothetical protein
MNKALVIALIRFVLTLGLWIGDKRERIALNEISLWSGGPQDAVHDSAYQYLKPIQDLLLTGKNKEAQAKNKNRSVSS